MLSECIGSQRSAFFSAVILSAFLLFTVSDIVSKSSFIHELERSIVIHYLFSESGKDLTLPYEDEDDSDVETITLRDAGFPNLTYGMALAHMNYALPIWFGENYCLDEEEVSSKDTRKVIYEWVDWEVRVSPNECTYIESKDYLYPHYSDEHMKYPLISNRLTVLDTNRIRAPYKFETLSRRGELVHINILTLLYSCLHQQVDDSDPQDPSPESLCHLKAEETQFSEDLFLEQVGKVDYTEIVNDTLFALFRYEMRDIQESEELTEEKENGVQLASLELELTDTRSGTVYLVFLSNEGLFVHRNNPNLTETDVVDFPLILPPWSEKQLTSEDIVEEIRVKYANSMGKSSNNIPISELLSWGYLEAKRFSEGKLQAPFVGSAMPISALLIGALLAHFFILVWMYFLTKEIRKLYTHNVTVSVPWLLKFVAESLSPHGRLRANMLDYLLGCTILLTRILLIIAPSLIVFLFVLVGGPALGYALPNAGAANLVLVAAAVFVLFASYIAIIELETVRTIYKENTF